MSGLLLLTCWVWAAAPVRLHADMPSDTDRGAMDRARTALGRLQAWLGDGENGRRWNEYLQSEALAAELAKGRQANAEVVAEVLQRYGRAGVKGLDQAPLVAVRRALEAWLDAAGIPPSDRLPQLARAEKERFRPVPPRRLVRARARLVRRFDQLDTYLQAGGANGQAWKKYLQWDRLARQLDPDQVPDIGRLVAVYRRLTADHPGLELPEFANLTTALERYIDVASVARMPELEQQYHHQLDTLAAELAQYVERPRETDRQRIGTRVGWLEGSGFAPLLVASIRRRLSQPNYYFQASARLLDAGMHRVVDTRDRVVDSILGTSISGTAHTEGAVAVRLVPSANRAVIETVFRGKSATDTAGWNGPVVIYSDGTTAMVATKRILIDATGLRDQPARSEATVQTRTRCIAATRPGCLGWVIERVAWRRVGQSKGEVDTIAARHAEARTERRVDSEAASRLATANARFLDRFRRPLLRRREFPRQFLLQTTDSQLMLTVLQADRFQLGAPSPPPPVDGNPDLAVRIHETLVNNLASALLAGKTVTDDQLRHQVLATFGKLPDELKVDQDDEPWSITFAPKGPLTVEFHDGGRVKITLRGQRFTSGDRRFRAMHITALYRVERTKTGTRLLRQGDLEIVPPGFVPGKSRLSASQIALRRLLTKRLGRLFKPEIVNEGLELPGRWKQVGKLLLTQMHFDRGWVALAWRLPTQESVADRGDAGAAR